MRFSCKKYFPLNQTDPNLPIILLSEIGLSLKCNPCSAGERRGVIGISALDARDNNFSGGYNQHPQWLKSFH